VKAFLRRLFLAAVESDATFERVLFCGETVWKGKCIHCGSALLVRPDGEPIGHATLEHIVPKAHGGTDDPSNLAIACASCNHAKGYRQDARGPSDEGYQRMIAFLRKRKGERARST
jgi:5-methylcytosine-specific restriction endonuclease McrA